jgi:hypothetical protein
MEKKQKIESEENETLMDIRTMACPKCGADAIRYIGSLGYEALHCTRGGADCWEYNLNAPDNIPPLTKLKDNYKWDELPGKYFTTLDIMEAGGLSETQAFEIMKYLEELEVGKIYMQKYRERDQNSVDLYYSKESNFTNREGFYIFVFSPPAPPKRA